MELRKYQKLTVWQDAMLLAERIYKVTSLLPNQERFGLSAQLRRAAVSIPSNIAEGAGRGSDKDFARFLQIARGSLQEVETQVLLAKRLGYIEDNVGLSQLSEKVFAKLNSLINKIT